MKPILFVLMILGGNLACAQPFSPATNPNVVSVSLKSEGVTAIFAINEPFGEMGEDPVWGYTDSYGNVRLFATPPVLSLMTVIALSTDTAHQYLMVYSAGEGHPMIDFYNLEDVWAAIRNGETAYSVVNLNPYPGYVEAETWDGSSFRFFSDMPFDKTREKGSTYSPEGEPAEEGRSYRITFPGGKIKAD